MPATHATTSAVNTKPADTASVVKAAAKRATPTAAKQPIKVTPTTKPALPVKVAAKKVATKETPAATKNTAVEKPAKAKKVKMVRDSFTFPKTEFAVLEDLKLRAAKLTTPIKKTELIRAGIKALAAMGDENFLKAIRAVPNLKTGRPTKS